MTMIVSGSDGLTFPDSSALGSSNFTFRNRIINGDMRIAQRGTSANPTEAGYFTVDRWFQGGANAVYPTIQPVVSQSTDAPPGFTNSYSYVNTNATTLTGTQNINTQQRLEGFNTADLGFGTVNAQSVTLSFWVKSSLTGKFPARLNNSAANRFYVTTYTINNTNTWEYKTVTIPGDTTGTWSTNNGRGVDLTFLLGSGPDRFGTLDVWDSTNVQGPSDMVQLTETAGATWQVTGVQFEVGSIATPFERRPYGTELALCQRYYYKQSVEGAGQYFGIGNNQNTTVGRFASIFPVTMRVAPTALEQSGTAGDYSIRHLTSNTACSSVPTHDSASTFLASYNFTVASGLTAGNGSFSRPVNSSAYLAWSVEL